MPSKSVPNSDPVRSAQEAGLRYVDDSRPGIRREIGTLGFKYIGTHGRVIRNKAEIARINTLAVPPAWTNVWICPNPRGHIQARPSGNGWESCAPRSRRSWPFCRGA
jgi:DNA topoisomerase-1